MPMIVTFGTFPMPGRTNDRPSGDKLNRCVMACRLDKWI